MKNHPIFGKSNFNIIGLSQGALIGRYIIQHCDLGKNKVHKFLSVGGPLMGTHTHPECRFYLNDDFCDWL